MQALKRTVEAAPDLGIDRLTVFGFSTENWRRPAQEVSDLMSLLKTFVNSDLDRLAREGVNVRVLGRRTDLTPDILDAARAFAEEVAAGRARHDDLTEAGFEARLCTAGAPPPDLIVRTSGERRLSNFLLWEAAYAEFVFQDVFWPDYGPDELRAAVDEYQRRKRRYGGADVDDVLATG